MENRGKLFRYLKGVRGRWPLAVMLILGVALLLFARPEGESVAVEQDYHAMAEEYRLSLESRLVTLCSSIEGVGEVSVTVTLECGEVYVYAKNEASGAYTVNSGEGLLLCRQMPSVLGVAVVCDGGGDDAVRLSVADAVGTVCGIGANKISISKKGG